MELMIRPSILANRRTAVGR